MLLDRARARLKLGVCLSVQRRSEFDLSSLKILSCGGSALALSVTTAVTRELPGCRFFMDYGMTECSGHICISLLSEQELRDLPEEECVRLSSCSERPFLGMDVRVVDTTASSGTAELVDVVTDGQAVGEVLVRGDTVFGEYWQNPPATADSRRKAVDGGANWFATGDMAVVDDKGFVNVVSRLKDMIIM